MKKIDLSVALGHRPCACTAAIYKGTRLAGLAKNSDLICRILSLAPLLEMMLSRKVLGSGGRYRTSHYGKLNDHIQASSYELGSKKLSAAKDTARKAVDSYDSILSGAELRGNEEDNVVVEFRGAGIGE
ncbi:hypothetical protein VTN00DRAFT_7176 [Thermoascus crustaceus]|uniref:uncharacterized protein n=1 Tax=Thermoascus crustaceus TaxID=5088 RepID=UPI003743197A